MSVFNLHQGVVAGTAAAAGGSTVFDSTLIGNSVWFDGSSDQLEMAKTSGGSASSKFTVSCWVQRNEFTEGTFTGIFNHYFDSNTGVQLTWLNADTLTWIVFSSVSGSGSQITTNEVFRDFGWYHILANYDGTNGRMQLFVNGEHVGSNDVGEKRFTAGSTNPIGSGTGGASYYWGACKNTAGTFGRTNSYLAQCALELGTAAVPSDYVDTFTFGTNGSQVIPKKTSDLVARINSAGGHSHLLDFSDASNLGNDISSNNNDFTATSMAAANQSSHTPSLSYPVLNIIDTTTATATSGNLDFAGPSADDKAAMRTTIGIPDDSGKYYWEYLLTGGSNDALMFGIAGDGSVNHGYDDWVQDITPQIAVYTESGSNKLYEDGSETSGTVFSTGAPVSGTTIGVAYDSATRKIWFASNNVYANTGNPAAGSGETGTLSGSGTAFPTVSARGSSDTLTLRFDSSDFVYSAPSGFKELNTKNLTAPTYQGIDYFDATTYEGNGGVQRVGDFVPFTDTYTVDKSAMFEYDDRRYLSFTPSSGGNQKTFTLSFWFKLTGLSDPSYVNAVLTTTGAKQAEISFRSSGSLKPNDQQLRVVLYNGSSFVANLTTDRAFAATDGWTHAVIAFDTRTGVAAANKIKIYINGVLQTTTGTQLSTDDYDTFFNNNQEHNIGRQMSSGIGEADAYFAEMVMVEGQQLDPSSFGQVDTSTNRWVPKDVSGLTFGDEGWYLEFDGTFNSGLTTGAGKDSSGNGNHWAEQNDSGSAWATTDRFTDTPSKNFCTWDHGRNAGHTLTEGALKATGGAVSSSQFDTGLGTMFVSSGKYYWEINRDNDPAGTDRFRTGVAQDSIAAVMSSDDRKDFWGLSENGQIHGGGLALTSGYGVTTTTGDYIGVALDMDRHAIYFSKNGTWMNSASASGIADGSDLAKAAHTNVIGSVTPFISTYDAQVATLRTASDRWESTAPTGFLELNQDNLDATASKLTALAIIKNRDAADDTIVQDRLLGTTSYLSTTQNDSGSAATSHGDGGSDIATTNTNVMQRFLQRGVQVGNDENVNTVNESYVLWQWLLGDSATTGSSITTGATSDTMATTGIVADAGHLSIVEYTGTGTAGDNFLHGLGAKPELVAIKRTTGSSTNSDWWTATQGIGLSDNNYFFLHYNLALQTSTSGIRTADITNDIVVVGNGVAVNTSGQTHRAYNFRSVPGVCKVGIYTGTGSSVYVHTGFKPRWILIKNTAVARNWVIVDTARSLTNPAELFLFTDERDVEAARGPDSGSDYDIDILSDGFVPRTADSAVNGSGNVHLYLAMADIAGNGTLPPIYGR